MFHHTKTLILAAVAVSLAACSTGSNSTDSQTSPNSSSPASSENSPSSQTTDTKISANIPGASDIKDVKLTPNSKNIPAGFFDGASGSKEPKQDVSKSKPFAVGGWAVLSSQGKVADKVIITAGDSNTVVAVVPTNVERPDVVQALKNPAFKNSGWAATINPATLPSGKVVLRAWAYNSASKEAIQLNNAFEANVLP
ncbi:MAG TPA: hypothetical protein DCE56_38590 [Cyanobacteria bacterium UBA8553]|nr:hypothetical protein [Cyanobacteria bacterium UBA8553]HAJ62084.1 hypothetical protein [Cyanobacteria bacterium UBA8543]